MQITFKAHKKQLIVCKHWLDDTVSDIVYGGSKGNGKSFLGCNLIFGDAFIYDGTSYFIARKTLKALRAFTIPSIMEVFGIWGVPKNMYRYNSQDNYFQLYNGSKVYLLDASHQPSDPDYARFGSMQFTRGWAEEAGEFEEAAINNLAAATGRWKNKEYGLKTKILQTCNPAKNYLYTKYYKPFKAGTLEPHKRFVQALPTDNLDLPPDYLPHLHRTLNKSQKERLLYGNWDYDDDPTVLCDWDAINDAFTNDFVEADGLGRISADLAMQGRDRFVAGCWWGNYCEVKISKSKATGKEIEEDLTKLMKKEFVSRSNVIADADGLGAYLSSYLNGINEFHGGASAYDKDNFANLKTECAYKLAEKINNRQIKIVCTDEQREQIMEELGVLKADNIDVDEGKKKIIKKETMKELIGRSPDYLDMLIMGQYWDVKPKSNVWGISVSS